MQFILTRRASTSTDNYIGAVEKAITYRVTSNFESSSESDSDHEARMKLRKRKIRTKQEAEKATKIQKSRQLTTRFRDSESDNSDLKINLQQSALVPLYQFQAFETNIQNTDSFLTIIKTFKIERRATDGIKY
ncbi:unnamed protein product [Allacma fusca]|uniref:Uncharacterized protein n=1 Tax=Allacma fusca TaxID=39272 RepID=A0A8J2KMR4_9HEXA|nr:unnamed protein product [Allacma fusca]